MIAASAGKSNQWIGAKLGTDGVKKYELEGV
jgi:hypothetical protein